MNSYRSKDFRGIQDELLYSSEVLGVIFIIIILQYILTVCQILFVFLHIISLTLFPHSHIAS